jgi:hypothetical protein
MKVQYPLFSQVALAEDLLEHNLKREILQKLSSISLCLKEKISIV